MSEAVDFYSESMEKEILHGPEQTEPLSFDHSNGVVVEPPEFDPDVDEQFNDIRAYESEDFQYDAETHQEIMEFGMHPRQWEASANRLMDKDGGLEERINANVDFMISNGLITEERYTALKDSGVAYSPHGMAALAFAGNAELGEEWLRQEFPNSPMFGGKGLGEEDIFSNASVR